MGFIRKDYEVKNIGVVLPEAYAQITRISVDVDGRANVMFSIQKNRENIKTKENIDSVFYSCKIDKDLPIYRQAYEKAKEDIFTEWEDDIVE